VQRVKELSKKVLFLFLFIVVLILPTVQADDDEEDRGKIIKIHQQIITETPLYVNSKVADYVDEIGQKLVKASGINKKYRFYVLDDPAINAFTPGYGYIYINRGLLGFLNSEAELAGVLAHEIAHNTQRHLLRRKTRSVLQM